MLLKNLEFFLWSQSVDPGLLRARNSWLPGLEGFDTFSSPLQRKDPINLMVFH